MGKLRGWGCAVGLWFHSLIEWRKVGDYLAPCWSTWLCLDQPDQGSSCCQTGNQYSALLCCGVHLPNCVSAHAADREPTPTDLSFLQIMISIRMSAGYIICSKMNPHSTTALDHCKDVLVVLLDFMVCFWIRIIRALSFLKSSLQINVLLQTFNVIMWFSLFYFFQRNCVI